MDLYQLLWKALIAVGLGLLVGLQRQRVGAELAGIRTFPVAAALGLVCGLLAPSQGAWPFAAGLLSVALLMAAGNLRLRAVSAEDAGQTTELAVLLVFALAAYLAVGSEELVVILGGVLMLLLHLKEPLHRFADRLGRQDFNAIVQFVLVTLVVLPVLPDRTFGPFDVLNPRHIWWMVVLIVGISLCGYLLYRVLGERSGSLAAGFLGGLISSTATTVSYARRSSGTASLQPLAARVILLSSSVVVLRVLLEIAVAAPPLLPRASVRLLPFGLALVAGALVMGRRREPEEAPMPEQKNPSELPAALLFALLYALILFVTAAARELAPQQTLWAVAAVSGLTDMDAITLSSARLTVEGTLAPEVGWRLVLVAAMSNLLFKAGIAGVLGGSALLRRIAPAFALAMAAGAVCLWW